MVNASPRGLYSREENPMPTIQEAGWATWLVWTGAEILAQTGIRSPDRPALKESIYRLRYPGPRLHKLHLSKLDFKPPPLRTAFFWVITRTVVAIY
jgi:hypothetical protein